MKRHVCAAVAALLTTSAQAQQSQTAPVVPQVPVVAVPAPAQSAAIVARAVTAPTGNVATLPANTELLLRLSQEVNSKRMKEGETFRVALAQDVMIGNFIVLPKGTPGTGYVSYRTGKGAFGKSAKMEVTMRSLDLPNGRTIARVAGTPAQPSGQRLQPGHSPHSLRDEAQCSPKGVRCVALHAKRSKWHSLNKQSYC
jgi:hypothetical protein